MKAVLTDKAPKPVGPYSQAVKAGKFLFGSGQIPIDPKTNEVVGGGIRGQTRRVLENVKSILEAAEYSLGDIASVTVFLKDLKDFKEFNEEYSKHFPKEPPARVTVQAADLPKGALIELSFIAYKD